MPKTYYLGIFAMAIVVVSSNILVQFLYGDWLTYGAFTYPIAFLITDLMNRLYGPSVARRVVFFGFVTGIICSVIGTQITLELEKDFYVPAVTTRIALASGSAFLLAQLLDIFIFTKLKDYSWWTAPLFSSIIGGALDTLVFFSMAFSLSVTYFLSADHNTEFMNQLVPILGIGSVSSLWVSLAIADYLVKLIIAIICLIPFRLLLLKFR